MVNLNKYFKPDEIAALTEKGPEFIEKFEKQQSNPLYKEANFLYNRVQLKQMEKAAEKYPNPLDPNDWTSGEMVNHALEEMVDLSHYITMIHYRLQQLEHNFESMKVSANYWREKYQNLKKEGE